MHLLKRASCLVPVILFSIPLLANAQTDYSASEEDSTLSNRLLDRSMKTNLEDLQHDGAQADGFAEMPILNPQSNSVIKICNPPKDLAYNMPIIGKKDTSKHLFDTSKLLPKGLNDDKNLSSDK